MTDTTTPIPSATEPLVDRYRKISPPWLPFFRQLFANVRANAAALFSVTETIDEINGKWSLDITEQGRIRGSITLDASETLTTFAVLADKFIVVHPTVDGTTIQAFVVGNILGTPTVGINGNLLVDGTILANALAVNELSAIVADLGTVTAGRIQNAAGTSYWDLDTGEFVIGAV